LWGAANCRPFTTLPIGYFAPAHKVTRPIAGRKIAALVKGRDLFLVRG